jgi:hypothetical protein
MSDLAIASLLLAFLVGLAVAAPTWGVDSRDGVGSDEAARRASWLSGRPAGQPRTRPAIVAAGALRTVAYYLDAEAAAPARPDPRLAEAC